MTLNSECPICMDAIDLNVNRVVTECGHAFHCSCLMQNAAHNGFGCPYCRSTLAIKPAPNVVADEDDYSDSDSETIDDELGQDYSDDALTSFRMFNQQLDNEEVEEEQDDDDEDDDEDDDDEDPDNNMPNSAYMTEKLMARGVTYEDLVKNILYQEHSSWDIYYRSNEQRSQEVYGHFRAIISQYTNSETREQTQEQEEDVPATIPVVRLVAAESAERPRPIQLPEVAELKYQTFREMAPLTFELCGFVETTHIEEM